MKYHNFVLQKLNQSLKNFGKMIFYPKKIFESVNFNEKPVILWTGNGKAVHPDFDLVTSGNLPEGYRIVGKIKNTKIDNDLMTAEAEIDDDDLSSEIAAEPSKYGISTGFYADIDFDHNQMKNIDDTNHVLLFPLFGGSAGVPNDSHSCICNTDTQTVDNYQLDNGIKMVKTMKTEVKNAADDTADVDAYPQDNATVDIETVARDQAELATQVSQQGSEIQQINTRLDNVEGKIDQILQAITSAMPTAPEASAAPAQAPAAVTNTASTAIDKKLDAITADLAELKSEKLARESAIRDARWKDFEKIISPKFRGTAARKEFEADPLAFATKVMNSGAVVRAATGNTSNSDFDDIDAFSEKEAVGNSKDDIGNVYEHIATRNRETAKVGDRIDRTHWVGPRGLVMSTEGLSSSMWQKMAAKRGF